MQNEIFPDIWKNGEILKNMEIIPQNYNEILKEVKNYIQNSKIVMYWNIGKILFKYSVDKVLMEQLSNDLQISNSNLYNMLNFYKAYPVEIPTNALNWSQYAVLSEIKDDEFRNILENKAIEEGLTVAEIKEKVKQTKQTEKHDQKKEEAIEKIKIPRAKLTPNRGTLYNYKIGKPYETAEICLDLGFSIFKKIQFVNEPKDILNFENAGDIVEVSKLKDDQYFVKKAENSVRKIHTYKGYLSSIVDGDTIRVIIDLGFDIFREEIIRLREVYADELGTEKGAEQKKILEKILKNVKFVVIRTYKTDMYGRYVADVFYEIQKTSIPLGKTDAETAQLVADNGEYLNQKLVGMFS
jgi:micrococcal nuclease